MSGYIIKNMKKLLILIFILPLVLDSCTKDNITPVTNTTIVTAARDTLFNLLNRYYLWYNEIPPSLVPGDYKDPYELLEAARYKFRDRWSFVEDYNSFMASMEGTFVGHGIRIGLDPANNARIVMIYKNSPLYPYKVRRGWILKKINGIEVAPILISRDGAAYNNLFGPSTAGYQNSFLFTTPRGNDTTILSPKASFTVNSVTYYDTLELKTGRTGYLVFDEFITPSSNELRTAFAFFKSNNIRDLILDLRYNSGGILSVAGELASFISGKTTSDVLVKQQYNDKNSYYNSPMFFPTVASPLNMTRLIVITTRETASASEVIINGLSPYLNVVTLGDTTNGKPTGMNVWTFSSKYVFAPVTFKLVNKLDFGDFYEGFIPGKYVSDDITHDFGDRNEYCLREAIRYIETGSFSTKSSYIYQRPAYFRERPGLMNNTFDISTAGLKK
jgi:carboxyl-terminal processing protease